MIPAAFPQVAPALSLSEVFGPLAPLAALAAIGALAVLVAVLATESWRGARRRAHARIGQPAGQPGSSSSLRPAA